MGTVRKLQWGRLLPTLPDSGPFLEVVMRTWFPQVVLFLALVPGCAQTVEEQATSEDEVMGTAFASKEALFAADMLYVRLNGWDGNKMSPAALKDETKVPNAELLVYRGKASSALHCPDAEATPADLVYKTKSFSLRTSGNLTNGTPKSSYKISLETKDDRMFGMRKLNLKSMWNDVSQMREALAWSLFDEAGVPASRHTYAKLCINNKYYGLYSFIEEVDKPFLKDRGFGKNDEGNFYKGYWANNDLGPATLAYRGTAADDRGGQYKKDPNADERTYRLKVQADAETPENTSYDDLATLIRVAHGKTLPAGTSFDSPEYARAMEAVFNVKAFLRWAAMNTLLGAWDNYVATPANYNLYNSGTKASPKNVMANPYFTWIPWDYDNILGIDRFGVAWQQMDILAAADYKGRDNSKNTPLFSNIIKNPAFLSYYLDALEWQNATLFTPAAIAKKLEKLVPRARAAAFLEGNFSQDAHTGRQFNNDEVARNGFEHHEFREGDFFILGIKHFVVLRHQSVLSQIAKVRSARGIAKGSSGATFPVKFEGLP